jgi:futalosine hydrolase
MNILLVAATYFEAEQIISEFSFIEKAPDFYQSSEAEVDILITGVGIPAMMFSLFTQVNCRYYDLIINFGIAGAYNKNLLIGDVVNVTIDRFADLLIHDRNNISMEAFNSSFNQKYSNIVTGGKIENTSDYPPFFHSIKKTRAVTVNYPGKYTFDSVEIESMEGAAFMMICKHFKKCFIQIRGISNFTGDNINNWDFKTPIQNYSDILIKFLKTKL